MIEIEQFATKDIADYLITLQELDKGHTEAVKKDKQSLANAWFMKISNTLSSISAELDMQTLGGAKESAIRIIMKVKELIMKYRLEESERITRVLMNIRKFYEIDDKDLQKKLTELAENIFTKNLNAAHVADHPGRGKKVMVQQQIITDLTPIRALVEKGQLGYSLEDIFNLESAIREWLQQSDHSQDEIDEFMSGHQINKTLEILRSNVPPTEQSL